MRVYSATGESDLLRKAIAKLKQEFRKIHKGDYVLVASRPLHSYYYEPIRGFKEFKGLVVAKTDHLIVVEENSHTRHTITLNDLICPYYTIKKGD